MTMASRKVQSRLSILFHTLGSRAWESIKGSLHQVEAGWAKLYEFYRDFGWLISYQRELRSTGLLALHLEESWETVRLKSYMIEIFWIYGKFSKANLVYAQLGA